MLTVEEAVFMRLSEIRGARADDLRRYGAVYLGSDFCPHLLPGLREVGLVREKFGKKVVLVTPILTGNGVGTTLAFIRKAASRSPFAEVVVNDWGMLHASRGEGFRVALGRLLFFQLKDLPAPLLAAFFRKYRVCAVETDDPGFIRHVPEGTRVSLHYPLRFLSFTRFCPHVRSIPSRCARVCEKKDAAVYSGQLQGHVYFQGNACFTRHDDMPGDEKVARRVFTPWAAEGRAGKRTPAKH